MIIVMKKGSTKEQLEDIIKRIKEDGLTPQPKIGEIKTIVMVLGNTAEKSTEPYEALSYVEHVFRVQDKKYEGVSPEYPNQKTIVTVDGLQIGSDKLTLMPGPCALEGKTQIKDSVEQITDLKNSHIGENIEGIIMRGGAFKPRTHADSFQGLKKEGLKLFSQIAHSHGLPIVTEVMDTRDVDFVAQYADILQIGARNSQNYTLLTEVGKTGKPVLLKRAMAGSIDELLGSGSYIVKEGNENLIFCLRGIKGLQENFYRNAVDIPDILYLKNQTRFPIIFDPSHSTGKRDYVIDASNLAVAAGVDGLLIDVHPYPEIALVDAAQQLPPIMAKEFMATVNYAKGAYNELQAMRKNLQSQLSN